MRVDGLISGEEGLVNVQQQHQFYTDFELNILVSKRKILFETNMRTIQVAKIRITSSKVS